MIILYALWLWALTKRAGVALGLAIDCLFNMLHGGSLGKTLSGEAWHQREHKWFFWTHRFIDWLFYWPKLGRGMPNHCQNASIRESENGGAWPGWWKKTKKVWAQRP
jgi:hypothetical protein